MTSPNPPAAPLDPAANPVDPVTGAPGADVGGSSPGGAAPVDDEGVLESLGKAISSPVRDAAATEDAALPPPGGKA
ncbi:hypothetical protein [Rubrivivax gelatinosus]|uniref:hypothetical protein n=1 Tax=Rubrivivax gelatinosus TaxID=28068 RepID=UPI0019064156|nr:hypothetical protein [Rubrivivax gelatinosus]